MKKLLVLWAFVWFLTAFSSAQTHAISYEYDNAGNRILRKVIFLTTVPDSPVNKPDSINSFKTSDLKFISYMEEVDGVTFNIYPNPTGGQFNVEMTNVTYNQKISIYLHSATGELIFRQDDVMPVNLVDIRNKENGTYLLTFVVAGKKRTWKVIKQ